MGWGYLQHPSSFGHGVTYGVQLCMDACQRYGAVDTPSLGDFGRTKRNFKRLKWQIAITNNFLFFGPLHFSLDNIMDLNNCKPCNKVTESKHYQDTLMSLSQRVGVIKTSS